MSNSDSPAYPHENNFVVYPGLTKRERIAMTAMQALITTDTRWDNPPNFVAARAAEHADALLAQLEE